MYIIWNLTRVCPWDCKFCCVSAVHAKNKSLANIQRKNELSFDDKITVLEMLAKRDWDIDFSGGDPLFYDDDRRVVRYATDIISKDRLSISVTGLRIDSDAIDLMSKVGSVEFTIDYLLGGEVLYRPRGYIRSSMKAIELLAKTDVKVTAVTVLYGLGLPLERLRVIYDWLCDNNVWSWSVLRFCPVGSGVNFRRLAMKDSDYIRLVEYVQSFSGSTRISIQHSLRVLRGEYLCHAATNTMGILPDGVVSACAWALNESCHPLENFRIGKLPEDNLDDILTRAQQVLGYRERKGYCRILRGLN